LDKEYWPEDNITKGDLLRYYCEASKVLLPYLKDRPLILKRYPNGIDESFFYQHNFEELPSFATGYQDDDEQYIVCNNLATLLYLVNLGTIAQNPFHSRTDIIDRPDYIVFDLDPGDVTYDVVCEVAQNLKKVLSSLKLQAYPKTSGSSGMHVLLPLKRLYSYQQVSDFAMLVAIAVEREIPDLVTVERTIKKRPKKSVYLDTMQNAEGKSAASVWSAREKPGATVSVPLFWSEVKPGLSPKQFTISNALENTNRNQHDFEKVLSSPQSLGAAMKLLEKKLA
jgi:bifunctional non-homologous end joining protein LigD